MISFAAADTVEVFGDYIHTYDIRQAQEDGATVPIFYTPREARLHLARADLDSALAELTGGYTAEELGDLDRKKSRWAALAAAAGSKERVDAIAKDLLAHFLDRIRAHYDGRVVIAVLAELAPGASILPHRDSGPIHTRSHRCHLPIVTKPDVDFVIDGGSFHLAPGRAYEVDNIRGHAVHNRGTERRVHLVCNVMPLAK